MMMEGEYIRTSLMPNRYSWNLPFVKLLLLKYYMIDSSHAYTAVDLLREASSILRSEAEQSDQHRYQATILANPTLGRPRFNIPDNQIPFLLLGLCIPKTVLLA